MFSIRLTALMLTFCLMTSASAQNNKNSVFQYMQPSTDEGLEALIEIAESGNIRAQYKLACIYLNRGLAPDNMSKCIKWFTKAAEQNYDSAQYKLGLCYYDGKGVEQDYPTALSWFRKAAAQGHQSAMFYIGRCYALGEGVEIDSIEAQRWMEQAADTDEELTPYQKQLNAEAIAIVTRQAEKGDPYAQYFLGLIYEDGKYTERDLDKAIEWFEKAAAQGHNKAKEHYEALCKEKERMSVPN